MGKLRKETLVEDLADEILDSPDDKISDNTGTGLNFSKPKDEREEILELDIEEEVSNTFNRRQHTTKNATELVTNSIEKQFDESDLEENLVKEYEETLATQMISAGEMVSKVSPNSNSNDFETKPESLESFDVEVEELLADEDQTVNPRSLSAINKNQNEDVNEDEIEDVSEIKEISPQINKKEKKFASTHVSEIMDTNLDKTEKVEVNMFNMIPDFNSPQQALSHTDAKLILAENYKLAQIRIVELEKENEKIVLENEDLATAAETFKNKVDQLMIHLENLEKKYKDLNESVSVEKEILLTSLTEKDREVDRVKQKTTQLENRLQMGVRKIKVRERDLENRLELVKMEGKALLQSKDELILNLKRQLDKLNNELENVRNKLGENNKSINQKQEVIRKTVKTLRLALSLLEVEDLQGSEYPIKKVD
jgi:predicted  nucleic acid-binding Zn-ribbon protein